MKGIKTILGIALATTGFGGAIAVGAVSATQNNMVQQAEAAGTKRIYADINEKYSGWETESGHTFSLSCHYWGGSSSSDWPGMAVTNNLSQFGRTIPYFDIPSDSTDIVITRWFDDDGTAAVWKRWNIKNVSENTIGKITNGFNFFQLYSDQPNEDKYKQGEGWGCKFTAHKAYDVTLHVEGQTSTDLAINWASYTPSTPSVSGKIFEGWYKDSSYKTAYTPVTPTGNFDLYAHFLTQTGEKTFYVKTMGGSTVNVYAFEEYNGKTYEQNGGWPGSSVCETSSMLNFNGGGILKFTVPYFVASELKMVLNINGDTNKSSNLDINDGSYYFANDGTYFYNGVTESKTGEAALAFDIAEEVNGATNASVCSVSKTKATSLVSRFDALTSKTTINNATLYTWISTVGDAKKDHKLTDLVSQLRAISTKENLANFAFKTINNNQSVVIFVIVTTTCLAISSIGVFFILKKKKHN